MGKTGFAMKNVLLVLGMSMLLGACAASREDMSRGNSVPPPVSGGTAYTAPAKEPRVTLVMVGTVGPLRAFNDRTDAVRDYWRSYGRPTASQHPEPPSGFLSESDYADKVAGWASMEVASVPGVGSTRVPVRVPRALVKTITFPPAGTSYFGQRTGDLVAGVSNDDHWILVTKVLCKDSFAQDGGKQFRECAKDYVRGRFDARTGKELGKTPAARPGGSVIDPVTYRRANAAVSSSN